MKIHTSNGRDRKAVQEGDVVNHDGDDDDDDGVEEEEQRKKKKNKKKNKNKKDTKIEKRKMNRILINKTTNEQKHGLTKWNVK